MTVTYLIRPSVCLSVTLSTAMFRRRHMYFLDCCHYFFVVIMSKVPCLIIMPRVIDIARHFILSRSFSRSKSRFTTCDMTVAFGEHQNFPCLKLIEIVILWVYYTIPLGFNLFWHLLAITFQLLKLHCLAGDRWRGFGARNAHMVHIVNLIRLKMVYTSWWRSLFEFQLLGECHCWWTSESPRAHVAKFSVDFSWVVAFEEHQNFPCLKLIEIVILWVYYTIPFGFNLFWHLLVITFQLLKLHCLAGDRWRGFGARNAHMVHIVNLIRLKMVYTSWWRSLFEFELLGECHCWLTSESPRAHVAKLYGRLQLIRSVWRASTFSVLKTDRNCYIVGLLHHPFWLQLILAPFGHYFSTFEITLFGWGSLAGVWCPKCAYGPYC